MSVHHVHYWFQCSNGKDHGLSSICDVDIIVGHISTCITNRNSWPDNTSYNFFFMTQNSWCRLFCWSSLASWQTMQSSQSSRLVPLQVRGDILTPYSLVLTIRLVTSHTTRKHWMLLRGWNENVMHYKNSPKNTFPPLHISNMFTSAELVKILKTIFINLMIFSSWLALKTLDSINL